MSTFTAMADAWIRERQPETAAGQKLPSLPDNAERAVALNGIPAYDPAAWAEDFHRWVLSNCVYRDRCFGGIGALHTDFCRWTLSHDSTPCRAEAFEQLLRDTGFLFADGLVYGLVLKEDWEQTIPFRARRTHARERNEE